MTDPAFDTTQARYDAAEPADDELDPAETVAFILEDLLDILGKTDGIEDGGPARPLSDRQATAAIWINGHEYSLTLNREG